jgi:hypothetical protein
MTAAVFKGTIQGASCFKTNLSFLSTPKRPDNLWPHLIFCLMGKGNSVPLQAWTGPEGPGGSGSQISRQSAREFGKVCQPYTPANFTHRRYSWYSFLLEAESTPVP